MPQTLEEKILAFQGTLSEFELLRFLEIRPSDESGCLLTGDITWKKRNTLYPSRGDRSSAVKSLGTKIMEFQKTLNEDELNQLLYELSGAPDKHQSKFGTECRDPEV